MRTRILGSFVLLVAMLIWGKASNAVTFGVYRPIAPIDSPDILDPKSPLERNINVLDQVAQQGELSLKPWADSYWPIEAGITAKRYADTTYASLQTWKERRDYVDRNSVASILQETNSELRARLIDQLSPAEKYDLLVGDSNFTLARAQWFEGERRWKKGDLRQWMGICEGSSAAATHFAEPLREVELHTPQGDALIFHALDIKALASLLWSSYNTSFSIAGSRCSNSIPVDDSGIATDPSCFNVNPGSFHIAVLNLLALRQRLLFVNRVPRLEVWNTPILGYEFKYFNLTSGNLTKKLSKAILEKNEVSQDRFRAYRSGATAFIVGVEMTVNLVMGYGAPRDGSEHAKISQVTYKYDLEIAASGEILGGEWHSESHPDFMWAVDPNLKLATVGDSMLGKVSWAGEPIPAQWLPAIQFSSQSNQPLEVIVKELVKRSSQ